MFWWFRDVLRLLREILREQREILNELHKLNHRYPTSVRIKFSKHKERIMAASVTLNVGQTVVATVIVLDQNGSPITNFDFGANPPQWAVDDTAALALAAGGLPNEEVATGMAASAGATLSVDVPGVANGHDSGTIVVIAPPPVQVPTSVSISFGTPTP